MEYLKIGMMKILSKTPIWNLVYPLLFGWLITNPIYLIGLSSIITIHILILVMYGVDLDDDNRPVYMLLSYFSLPIIIYVSLVDKSSLVKRIKNKILVKMGKRIPDNWDNEKL